MNRQRAADDFATIRARMEELRRERDGGVGEPTEAPGSSTDSDAERRRRERIEGYPPPWVPTIFIKKPRV